MRTIPIIRTVTMLAATSLRAQFVSDGATATLTIYRAQFPKTL